MSEYYKTNSLFLEYAKWHYSKGAKELVFFCSNILWFITHFFSFSLLIKTLFSPWRKMGESYGRGLDLGRIASTFIVNSLMRFVGFITRTVVLLVGFCVLLSVCIFDLVILLVWFFAPIILLGCLFLSIAFFIL